MRNSRRSLQKARGLLVVALAATSLIWLAGCNDAQAGSLLGAGIGALAGQAIGGDTQATVIGAGVGAAGGYVIGNEVEKSRTAHYGGHFHPHGHQY